MGAICAVWELLASYGSHMEALWAVWEVDGTIWEPTPPDEGHMEAGCAILEVDGLWDPCGAIWEADSTIWQADATIWELRAQHGAHMGVVSQCGSHVHCMGAVCTVWAPCMPYESHTAPNGRRMVPGGSHPPYGSHQRHMGA
jgi:hypothetical protein